MMECCSPVWIWYLEVGGDKHQGGGGNAQVYGHLNPNIKCPYACQSLLWKYFRVPVYAAFKNQLGHTIESVLASLRDETFPSMT